MLKTKIGRAKASFTDSIQEVKMSNYVLHKRLCLIDSAIGSDQESAELHEVIIECFKRWGMEDKARLQTQHRQQCLQFIKEGTNVKLMSLVALLVSWKGKPVSIQTEDDIKHWCAVIGKSLKPEKLKFLLSKIRENMEMEIRNFFPKLSNDVETIQYYTLLKQRTLLVLNAVINEDILNQIESIDKSMISTPQRITGPKGIEVQMQKTFEYNNTLMQSQVNGSPADMTHFKYHAALEVLEKKNKPGPNNRNLNNR